MPDTYMVNALAAAVASAYREQQRTKRAAFAWLASLALAVCWTVAQGTMPLG
ncbi:hypothetical protein GCM10023222_28700 [Saccharopolyspora cebuensis]|uniref:Uncharacterized protein n=1 Tax=Saccharopolyspora cebuensis TaxID=418759 RepID=A0ABV4CFX7_9PSEU